MMQIDPPERLLNSGSKWLVGGDTDETKLSEERSPVSLSIQYKCGAGQAL